MFASYEVATSFPSLTAIKGYDLDKSADVPLMGHFFLLMYIIYIMYQEWPWWLGLLWSCLSTASHHTFSIHPAKILSLYWILFHDIIILVEMTTWCHDIVMLLDDTVQGCIFRLTCSYPELTEDHVLTSAYVKIFRTITRNAVNKSVWRKNYSWLPLNKHAMNIFI